MAAGRETSKEIARTRTGLHDRWSRLRARYRLARRSSERSDRTLVVFICNHCPYVNAAIDRMVAEGKALGRFIIPINVALVSTSAFAFSPSDCGIDGQVDKPSLRQYCARLREKAIASDPGHGLIGTLEKADPIIGEPASQHYYWIVTTDGQQIYFDGNSVIGQRILKVCKVGQLCAVKVGQEKSWEHNVDHATFWITKIIGEPIGE